MVGELSISICSENISHAYLELLIKDNHVHLGGGVRGGGGEGGVRGEGGGEEVEENGLKEL